jgi:hypothetical protein
MTLLFEEALRVDESKQSTIDQRQTILQGKWGCVQSCASDN